MDAISIIAEQRIREACERGAFDSLPGAGKPLELEDNSLDINFVTIKKV